MIGKLFLMKTWLVEDQDYNHKTDREEVDSHLIAFLLKGKRQP